MRHTDQAYTEAMSRRYLYIAIGVLTAIGGGMLIYFFFFTGSAGVEVAPGGGSGFPAAGQVTPGSDGAGGTAGGASSDGGAPGAPTVVSARLVQISAGPVVPGEAVITKKATSASSSPEAVVHFIERESGNVFSYSTLTKTLTRTSNKTIPGIQSAIWLPDASIAFVRYLSGTDFSTINSYALPADGAGGYFLSQNLADVSVSATQVLTLASGVNGSTASLAQTDGARATAVFSTPLSSLDVSFAGKSRYLATTRAAATLPGYAFLVDGAGRFSRIAGPRNGLAALASPSGTWVLVSYVRSGSLLMELVNTETGETIALPIATLVEKCVWTADETAIYCGVPTSLPSGFAYPDDWYQGAVHFTDHIWKIQVSGRYAQFVLDFSKDAEAALDAEALAIDPSLTTLVFVNRNDGSLWSYTL